ncbi:TIGR01777 family oxidoreductase [Gammaproteobacteria bacterium AS21]
MNILMTGGTGLIGKSFIETYPDYHYSILTRDTNKTAKSANPNISFIHSLSQLTDLNDFDAVINLCGEPIMAKRWSLKQKDIINMSRWQTTQTLVDLISKSTSAPKVFLSGSAIGIYADRENLTIDENITICDSDFASKLCLQWESIANKACQYSRVVNLRTGIVLSTKGGALTQMLPAYRAFLGGEMAKGRHFMSWIHIDDMVKAMHFLLISNQANGPYNLTAPHPVTNAVFNDTLAYTLHKKAIFTLPKWCLNIIFGESATILLTSQKVIPKKLLEQQFCFSYPVLQQALQHLLNK